MNGYRIVSYLFIIALLVNLSCKKHDEIAIKYAKRINIHWWINNNKEKVSLEFALNDLAKRFNGNIQWFNIPLSNFDEMTQKILKRKYPKSRFVGIKILNSNQAVLGVIMVSVNTKKAILNLVEADLTGFKYINPKKYNIYNLSSDLNLIAELIDDNTSNSYLRTIKAQKPQIISKLSVGDYCEVNTNKLNLRESPSTKGKVIGSLVEGTKIRILELTNESWVKVKLVNGSGYVFSKYLTKIEPGNEKNDGKSKIKIIE